MFVKQCRRITFLTALGLACIAHAAVRPQNARAIASPVGGSPLTIFGLAHVGSGPRLLTAKFDGTLARVAQRAAALSASGTLAGLHGVNPAARFRQPSSLSTPEILIDATANASGKELRVALEQLGLENASVFGNAVGGWLPVDQLQAAAALPQLRLARASMPRTRAAVATQGDFVQGSAQARSNYSGLSGAGVTVGVMSDSFNCYQVYAGNGTPASGYTGYAFNGFTATYATDQSTGALPAGVSVLLEPTFTNSSGTDPQACVNYGQPYQTPFTDEGRAISQIVHVVAPGAKLAFRTAIESEADFANGIIDLANAGAQVIDDDVGYPDEPFFEDGIVAQAINEVAAGGIAYFSSAGNDGSNSYESKTPSFATAAPSGPNAGEKLLNFDTSGVTTTTALPLTIPQLYPGEYLSLVVEWDQPYISGCTGACTGATNQLDLCVTAVSGSDVVTDDNSFPNSISCTGANALGGDPVLYLIIGNSASASQPTSVEHLSVQIGLVSGTAPGRVKFLLDDDGAGSTINSFATYSPTIQGHPNAVGAAAVGAVFFFNTPACQPGTQATVESFSSIGGDPILFDSSSAGSPRLATPGMRTKPDFVATDGVQNTFLGGSLEDYGYPTNSLDTSIAGCQETLSSGTTYYPNFFGTSAAAPHAAGAAALMLQANPALTPTDIVNALKGSAVAVNGNNSNASGAGFIQVDTALTLMPLGAPTLSISPAALSQGSSATLTWSSPGAASCSASGNWSGALAASGTQTVTPTTTGTETFSLTCTNIAGPSTGSAVSLTVTAPPSSHGGGGALDGGSLLGLAMSWLYLRSRARQRVHYAAA